MVARIMEGKAYALRLQFAATKKAKLALCRYTKSDWIFMFRLGLGISFSPSPFALNIFWEPVWPGR